MIKTNGVDLIKINSCAWNVLVCFFINQKKQTNKKKPFQAAELNDDDGPTRKQLHGACKCVYHVYERGSFE